MKILFVDKNHRNFFVKKVNQIGKADSYSMSLLYLLSMTNETRTHFGDLFNVEAKEINIDGLDKAWQTGTSSKITRLAFNLWNGYSNNDENLYSVDNIFCCSYAPFLYEAIKLRYPSYTNQENMMEELNI